MTTFLLTLYIVGGAQSADHYNYSPSTDKLKLLINKSTICYVSKSVRYLDAMQGNFINHYFIQSNLSDGELRGYI